MKQFLLGAKEELEWTSQLGAVHHARWMSKVIFILKIFIVGDRFKLSNNDRSAIRNLTEFIIYLYAYYWFKIPVASDAPFLTLQLWKDLKGWEANNKKIAIACMKKLDHHTWYIMVRHIVFSFQSKMVERKQRRKWQNLFCHFLKWMLLVVNQMFLEYMKIRPLRIL